MKKYKVVGIGNAVVDVISQSSDAFLQRMGIEKGIMQLIEKERAEALYDAMENRVQAAGGAVANTLAGLGALGLETAFVGRVRDDELGRFYAQAMRDGGTDFVNPPVQNAHLPTSRSMIFTSSDGERSMNTYLGISSELGPEDVSAAWHKRLNMCFWKAICSIRIRANKPLLSCRVLVAQPVARPESRFPIPSALNGTARIFWI